MKWKINSVALCSLFLCTTVFSQRVPADSANHYNLKTKVEIPAVAAGAAFAAFNFSRISKKAPSSEAYVESLKKTDVNWFDRWGVRPYSESIDNVSYIPFYVAMPLPMIVFVVDKKMRKDFFKLTFLYVEAITITGVLYSSAAAYANRLRPLVYSSETPLNKRTASDSRKSFFAGHVALVATSAFFAARVLADYHPESRFKWLYYSVAGAATIATGYMRQAAGEHFLSDILVGTTVGTLSGLLTPALHKNKLFKNQRMALLPFGGQGAGLTVLYRL
ncbi:MAG: phosphatase PAP2 family protein [Bacteroidota bacterium]